MLLYIMIIMKYIKFIDWCLTFASEDDHNLISLGGGVCAEMADSLTGFPQLVAQLRCFS